MDAEFVEFLDKKFGGLEKRLMYEIRGIEERLGERITSLEAAVERLATSIDRLTKLYEDVFTEQKAIIADIDRIKTVLKEKLGVDI